MESPSIFISFGPQTENFLQEFLKEIDDATIDEIEINRQLEKSTGLASEPITIAVTISASSVIIVSIVRVVERWIEKERQNDARNGVIKAAHISDKAAQALVDLEKKHADISISYKLSQEKGSK